MRLQGKVAIVTGAASGFGAEIARQYAKEGAKVALADINEAGAKDVAGPLGAAALAVKCDVTQRADIDALALAESELWTSEARGFGKGRVLPRKLGVLEGGPSPR